MTRLLLSLMSPIMSPLVLATEAPSVRSEAWRQVEIADVCYVSVEDIMKFYQLEKSGEQAGVRSYGDSRLSLVFDESRPFIAINGVGVKLMHPLLKDGRGEALISKDDCVYLLDPILRPSYISPRWTLRRVVIDPSHGGEFEGVRPSERKEKSALTLQMAQALAQALRAQGIEAILTRDDDYYVNPQERINLANAQEDSLYIRLRVDDCAESESGLCTYIADPDPQRQTDGLNAALGMAIQASVVRETGLRDAGLRRLKNDMTAGVRCPAVTLALGNMAHASNRTSLHDSGIQSRLAGAVQGAINVFAVAVAQPEPLPEAEPEPQEEFLPEPQPAMAQETEPSPAPEPASDELQAIPLEEEIQAVEVD